MPGRLMLVSRHDAKLVQVATNIASPYTPPPSAVGTIRVMLIGTRLDVMMRAAFQLLLKFPRQPGHVAQ